MTTETYLYRSDPYRASTFANPWPLSLTLKQPDETRRLDGHRFQGLVPRIHEILEEHSIHRDESSVRMVLASKPGYHGSGAWTPGTGER